MQTNTEILGDFRVVPGDGLREGHPHRMPRQPQLPRDRHEAATLALQRGLDVVAVSKDPVTQRHLRTDAFPKKGDA